MSLFKKKEEESTEIKINTFTKLWVNRTLVLSWICIFWCFLLATIGREQVAENLAVAIVANNVGVFAGYFAKSFFETKEEKRLERKSMDYTECNGDSDSVINDDDNMHDL